MAGSNILTKYKKKFPWISSFTHLKGADVLIGEVDPKELPPNPKNWRIHSQRQRSTYKAFQEKFGFLGVAIFNLATNRLLDGHMRVDEAIKCGNPTVPLIVVDEPDETRENEILATLDNIGLLAQRNEEALLSLTKAVDQKIKVIKTDGERKLKQLRKDIQETPIGTAPVLQQAKTRIRPEAVKKVEEDEEEPEEDVEEDSQGFFQTDDDVDNLERTYIKTNVMFDGLTDMGIPELLLSHMATPDMAPRYSYPQEPYEQAYHCYSQTYDGTYSPGCIGFYTHDEKFEAVFNQADDFIEWIKEIEPGCLISPDFSAYTTWPGAKSIYNVYRSRWCARLWQQFGFYIIPTVQILDSAPYTLTTKYVLETLPVKATLSIECRTDEVKKFPKLISWINKIISVCKPECLVLYGGEEKQKYIIGDLKPNKTELIFLPQIITVKQRKRR